MMQEVIVFALLGLGVGAIYSLSSLGLIAIQRGAGVLNFAQGAIGTVGVYIFWEFHTYLGLPYGPAFVAGVVSSGIIGVVTYLGIMRRLRHASALVRIVATLAVLTVIESVLLIVYGTETTVIPSELPGSPIHITKGITVSTSTVIILGIAAVVSVGLAAMYTRTKFGRATTAMADNQRAAEVLGWSPDFIATANWALGSALAGAAAILVAPILQLQVETMTNVMLAAVAAALLAEFRSFVRAFWAGLAIGIIQTLVTRYVSIADLGQAVPFIVVIIWLVATGRGIPAKDFAFSRLPSVGTGRIRWVASIGLSLAACLVIAVIDPAWQVAFATTFAVALVLLSLVVLTGYTGQISLAQYALAGVGAFVSGRLASVIHLPFVLAVVVGVAVAVIVGIIFATPALRTRGLTLAVVTLGLASAVEYVIFDSNADWAGGFAGTPVSSPTVFGLSVDPIVHSGRYAMMCVIAYFVAAVMVANVRRGRSGRRLLATRANERAAAALGISVTMSKLYAFALAAGIAALGGILLAFQNADIVFTDFTGFTSITLVAFAVAGGLGYLWGPLVGATFVSGSVGSEVLNSLFPGLGNYIGIVGGGMLIFVLLFNQDGIASEQIRQFALVRRLVLRRSTAAGPKLGDDGVLSKPPMAPSKLAAGRFVPRSLEIHGLSVRFGGVTAVNNVSLAVPPGRVVGLIGPNGAGKTTVVDAVTGFVSPMAGRIVLDGQEIGGWGVARRARAGISRTFQHLELFEDMTVIENLRAACDRQDLRSYAFDLVAPVNPPLSDSALVAIEHFRLRDHLAKKASALSYGERRLVAIARSVAALPSVLLLDEPAAGLSAGESAELSVLVRGLAEERGLGILLVEHDMSFVMSVCDEIVVMDFGQRISAGSPSEVRSDPLVVAAYLGVEAESSGPPGAAAARAGLL